MSVFYQQHALRQLRLQTSQAKSTSATYTSCGGKRSDGSLQRSTTMSRHRTDNGGAQLMQTPAPAKGAPARPQANVIGNSTRIHCTPRSAPQRVVVDAEVTERLEGARSTRNLQPAEATGPPTHPHTHSHTDTQTQTHIHTYTHKPPPPPPSQPGGAPHQLSAGYTAPWLSTTCMLYAWRERGESFSFE